MNVLKKIHDAIRQSQQDVDDFRSGASRPDWRTSEAERTKDSYPAEKDWRVPAWWSDVSADERNMLALTNSDLDERLHDGWIRYDHVSNRIYIRGDGMLNTFFLMGDVVSVKPNVNYRETHNAYGDKIIEFERAIASGELVMIEVTGDKQR